MFGLLFDVVWLFLFELSFVGTQKHAVNENDKDNVAINKKIYLRKFVFFIVIIPYIHIKYISVNETAGHASLRYLSTLAVLQLDAILPNAVLREKKAIKWGTKNQKGFNSMLIMEYYCPAIGLVRLTVGQKRNDGAKVQYCITAIEVP